MQHALKLIVCFAVAGAVFHSAAVDDSIARQILDAHNAVRMKVGVPPLSWSEKLATAAQRWAEELLHNGTFAHQANNPYGENLFEIRGATTTPAEVVNDWASEARNYRYRDNSCSAVCGHYTQIIWRDTKETGCGMAQSNARQVWVCEYFPPGNIEGQRPY